MNPGRALKAHMTTCTSPSLGNTLPFKSMNSLGYPVGFTNSNVSGINSRNIINVI